MFISFGCIICIDNLNASSVNQTVTNVKFVNLRIKVQFFFFKIYIFFIVKYGVA